MSTIKGKGRINAVFNHFRDLSAGPPPDLSARLVLLDALRKGIVDRQSEIREAVWADFRKSDVEAELTEVATVLLELQTATRNLGSWMAPTSIPSSIELVATNAGNCPAFKACSIS